MNIYEQCKVLSVNNLVFKAIGKIVLKNNSEWNIPHLHFMVNKSEDNIYEAVCLELSFFNSGKNIEEATTNLITNILSYFNYNIKSSSDLDKILGNIDTNIMDMYWRKYRVFDYQLAKIGSDINSQLEKQIIKKVEDFYKNKIAEYEKKIKELIEGENLELSQKYGLNELNIKEIA
ncbi:hypothetical protein [Brachyspira aalborgi]|uniref:hypothetical protein n=1 Tax=Brachyspira aalborgi TaxID=29522 RepID=UPI0011CCA705|nr:hypothetical protein [Brachyspira aalborgi]